MDALSNEEYISMLDLNIDINNISNFPNGNVLYASDKKGLFIKTKNGIISVLEIQGENAKKMEIKEFLRGNKINLRRYFQIHCGKKLVKITINW